LDVGAPDTTTPAVDAAPASVDVAALVDTTPVVDASIPDVTIVPDAPIVIDTARIETAAPVDVTAPVDTTAPIDTAPVVCTMTTPFTGGAVDSNLTLTKACSPYTITDGISVNGNATLTIEAGATLRFDPDCRHLDRLQHRGQTGRCWHSRQPNHLHLVQHNAERGRLGRHHALEQHHGRHADRLCQPRLLRFQQRMHPRLGCKAGRVSIDHVTINHVGPGYNGIDEGNSDSNFTISNCTFSNIPTAPTQQYAISVEAPSFAGIDSTNTFNGGAMIELAGGDISVSTDWKNPGSTVTIAVTSGLSLGGTTTPILTIAAGSVFKFASDTYIWVGYSDAGNLKVNGTLAAPVVFTSLNTSPAPGDWEGITLVGRGPRHHHVRHHFLRRRLQAGDIAVESGTNVLDIENSTLSYSGGYGIGIACGSLATLTNTGNTFTATPAAPSALARTAPQWPASRNL
jgi:hypothetical protein